MADHCFSLPLFLHCLPFGAGRAVLRDAMRYRTLAATQAATRMPVLGDWNGTGTPVPNPVARSGQPIEVSLVDTASNYNLVIAAKSGSGKPFLTDELLPIPRSPLAQRKPRPCAPTRRRSTRAVNCRLAPPLAAATIGRCASVLSCYSRTPG